MDNARHWARTWLVTAAAAALAVGAWSLLPVDAWLRAFSDWANGFGPYGLLIFGALFFLATLLVVPGTPLTIAGAVAYGWAVMPVVLVAATLGSWLAFFAARYLFRDRLRRLIDRKPRLRATVEAVGDGGWRLLTLMRLSPFVPFNAQNYALGVTDVGTTAYLVSTVIGMLPGTVVCVYLGAIGRRAGSDEPTHWITLGLGLGLVATVVAVELTRRRVKAKLEAGPGGASERREGHSVPADAAGGERSEFA
ncbi:TVP38/TMEM64 family protein [Methylobacterium sp. Leaf118]|uniref:TVP38/TMEM64 family protein n=1 Tax=Methylobacterium sp. Leaf118 TaxID=2876562 RepID=UPI001E638B91|nr:TVP38/TMEM64 family protein [Methylobacterium sp. Leaf118]